ncbi:16S rRNA (guanine(527)-N(7))-methyltransferase RsmG [Spongiibacter tropicus]|uniref:16S rRNA (guanine(527)-N(7))-methyltransferase RsmG n=1 Tax=Spongiibacter tropicus TaxID=454602 RepID=UPI003A9A4531
MSSDFSQALTDGARQLHLEFSPVQQQLLLDYLALLHKWNRAYNLTAVRDPAQMLNRHLLDSLSIASLVQGQRVLDVGTGPGLPGIPLAILFPERQFELLDSNGKKTRFLIEARAQLGLRNVEVHCDRVEALCDERGFDAITSRAFASLADMAQGCEHLLAPGGKMFAMKGLYPEQELSQLPKRFIVETCHTLSVPGVDEARHLLVISPRTGEPAASEQ